MAAVARSVGADAGAMTVADGEDLAAVLAAQDLAALRSRGRFRPRWLPDALGDIEPQPDAED